MLRTPGIAITIALTVFTSVLHAKTRAVSAPAADALGIGRISGSALSGTVASISGTVITLNSGAAPAIRIETASAKFSGRDGASSIADVKPGARITAFLGAAGPQGAALSAQLINVDPPPPDLSIAGPIDSIDVAGSAFVVLGIASSVDSSTRFASAFPTFAPLGLSSLTPGQTVAVDAVSGATLLARRVLVVSPTQDQTVTLRGTVKSISDKSWVLAEMSGQDRTLVVDERTRISGDPKTGDEVQVLARVDSSSNTIALAIIKLAPPTEQFEFRGYVLSIEKDSWKVGPPPGTRGPEMLVKITRATAVYLSPVVGERVVVIGFRDSTGENVALKISKE